MKKTFAFKYTLMLIIILIFLVVRRYADLTRNRKESVNSKISMTYFLKERNSNCKYQTRSGYEFTWSACNDAKTGLFYSVIGTVRGPSDNRNSVYYSIDISSITRISNNHYSALFIWQSLCHRLWVFTGNIRDKLVLVVNQNLTSDNKSLFLGLVLGSKLADFSSDFRLLIQKLGLSHMVAVSGFHLGVIYVLISQCFGKLFSRKLSVVLTILILIWYSLLVSTPLSLLRALFMLILSLIGRNFFYKCTNSLLILVQVLLIMSLFSVFYLFNLGFQLSFLATAGILMFGGMDVLNFDYFSLDLSEKSIFTSFLDLVVSIKAAILTSLWAQLMSFPVLVNSFGEIAPWGILSSLLFSSALGLLVSFGVPLLTASIFLMSFSALLFLILPYWSFLNDFLSVLLAALRYYAKFFGFLLELDFTFSKFYVCIYFGLILVLFLILSRCKRRKLSYVF